VLKDQIRLGVRDGRMPREVGRHELAELGSIPSDDRRTPPESPYDSGSPTARRRQPAAGTLGTVSAAANRGILASIVSIVAVREMRKKPGVSNIRPGSTSTPSRSRGPGERDLVGERRLGEQADLAPTPVARADRRPAASGVPRPAGDAGEAETIYQSLYVQSRGALKHERTGVYAPGRVNDVIDAIQHRVLGQDRGVVLSNGLLRAFGLLGSLLSSIFVAGLVGLLLAR